MKMIELTLFILVFISVSVGHADKAVEWSIGWGGGDTLDITDILKDSNILDSVGVTLV